MANGDRYAGDFGAYPDPHVAKFRISFFLEQAQGKLSGVGVSLTKKGLYYGQWALGQERGLGRRYLNDGSVYVGIHENGRRSGDGIQYSSNGLAILSGRWEGGKLSSVHSLSESRFPFRGDMAFPTVAWPHFDVTFSDGVDQNSSSKHAHTAASSQANGVTPRPADTELAKLQTEVLLREREQAATATRQTEEKRLKARLAELDRQSVQEFNDDLPSLLAKLPVAKPNSKVYVFAVGIDDYADVPDVPFADRSANQFSEVAQKLVGAQKQNVIVLTNAEATSGRLRGRLRTILNRLGPQDQLLFYYAGHGVPGKNGRNAYLLAQDGGPGSYEEPDLQLEQLYTEIAKSRVGQAKLFIDAFFWSGR